jgi:hypothetical protein
MRGTWRGLGVLAATIGSGAAAQTISTIDTEDAGLGSLTVGAGRFHPTIGLDVRNGDFARGGYDDDAANLRRVPVHVQIGFGFDLHRDTQGETDLWLIGSSSNGVHSPIREERVSPRGWYESNNLIGLVGTAAKGLTLGAAYTIKASPNGIAGTSHEASVTAAYEGDSWYGALHPSLAATVRPKGGHGLFTQAGVEPQVALRSGDDAPTLSLPAVFGVGWGGFYEAGTGTVTYGSLGLAYAHPFVVGAAHWRLRVDGAAVIRDDTLRFLGSADAETDTIVPLVTISLATAF